MKQIPKTKDAKDWASRVQFKDEEWNDKLRKLYPSKQQEEAKSNREPQAPLVCCAWGYNEAGGSAWRWVSAPLEVQHAQVSRSTAERN